MAIFNVGAQGIIMVVCVLPIYCLLKRFIQLTDIPTNSSNFQLFPTQPYKLGHIILRTSQDPLREV